MKLWTTSEPLWRGAPVKYPLAFFHLNKYAHDPVVLHTVEGGAAREILYGPDYFDFSSAKLDVNQIKDLGFAGFRVLDVSGSLATKGNFFGATSRNIIMVCERPPA